MVWLTKNKSVSTSSGGSEDSGRSKNGRGQGEKSHGPFRLNIVMWRDKGQRKGTKEV